MRALALCFSLSGVVSSAALAQQAAIAANPAASQAAAVAAEPVSAKLWVGKVQEIEEFIRTAPPVKITDVPIGVAKPKRAYFAPNPLVESINWKKLSPGIHGGHWDSYKGDIAGYELNKLLEMDMVPPTVERRLEGDLGAAILWVKRRGCSRTCRPMFPRRPTRPRGTSRSSG